MNFRFLACVLAVLAGSQAAGVTPAPSQTLTAHEAGVPPARFFGQSMASSGQWLAVGAPYATGGGGAAPGVVLLYHRSNNAWSFAQSLQAPVPANGDSFGYHLAFAGSQLLVSAPFSTVTFNERGAVHVYAPVANVYTHVQTVNPGIALGTADWFGFHSSTDAGWLAIGVPLRGPFDAGQVHLYFQDPDTGEWIYHSLITGTANQGRLGIRMLMRGDRLLVSAPEEVDVGNNRGWVYAYLRTGSGVAATWTQVQRFRHVGNGISVFGAALALSPNGSRLLVGAPYQTTLDGQSTVGAAFAFERNLGGSWTQTVRLDPPDLARAANFGGSLGFSGEKDVLIGDIRENVSFTSLGAAHALREISPNRWVPMASWQRGPGAQLDFMGASVMAFGTEVLVAASGLDVGASVDEGQVFAFADALPLFRDGLE
jgi:hypothetical protein